RPGRRRGGGPAGGASAAGGGRVRGGRAHLGSLGRDRRRGGRSARRKVVIHPHRFDGAQVLRGRDIVCFSNDWDGDPLSKTHIMKVLSRENRILWVNSVANRRPTASARDLGRIGKKLGDALRGLSEPWPNLHVLGPLALPAFGTFARRVN